MSTLANNTADSWWKDPGLKRNVGQVIICYLAIYSLGYDGSLLNGLQALPTWNRDFDRPAGYTLGLIAASYYLPKIFFAPIIALINDKYGRKVCILVGAVLMIAGAVFSGLCQNQAQLIGSRIFIGVGTATSQISAATMIPELAHPRLRHMCGSYLLTMFSIGSIFASWFTFGMVYLPNPESSLQWKIPSFMQGFGPILLLAAFLLPESPRWLMKRGRREEAHAILAKYHANGLMDDELVLHELAEIDLALKEEETSKSTTYADFFRTSANKRRLAIIILIATATQLVGNGVVQFFLVPVLRQVGITAPGQLAGINSGLSVWNWMFASVGAFLVERVGRRKLLLTTFIGMFFAMCMIAGLSGGYSIRRDPALGLAIVPFIFFFTGAYAISLTPVPLLYVPEIVPYSMRAKSVGIFIMTNNICLAFNNFVNPIALAALNWKYYLVYIAAIAGFGTLFYFFVRETKGLTVEEAALIYEEPEVRQALLDAAQLRSSHRQDGVADDEKLDGRDEKIETSHVQTRV